MAGVQIIHKVNDTAVMDLLGKMGQRGRSMRPAMKIIGEIGVRSVRENFIASGRPKRWAPLASSTKLGLIGGSRGYTKGGVARGRLRAGSVRKLASKKILIGAGMSGGLMGSIHYKASSDSVAIGTDKPYGAAHHFGVKRFVTVRRSVKTVFGTRSSSKSQFKRFMHLPARPFVMLQQGDWPVIKRVLEDYLLPK